MTKERFLIPKPLLAEGVSPRKTLPHVRRSHRSVRTVSRSYFYPTHHLLKGWKSRNTMKRLTLVTLTLLTLLVVASIPTGKTIEHIAPTAACQVAPKADCGTVAQVCGDLWYVHMYSLCRVVGGTVNSCLSTASAGYANCVYSQGCDK